MRCVSVCIRGEWFRVPCSGPAASIRSLGCDALQRYHQATGREDASRDMEFSMRKCRGGELLHPGDKAEDVLEDNDFVQLGMLPQLICLHANITERDNTIFLFALESLQEKKTDRTCPSWQCILLLAYRELERQI